MKTNVIALTLFFLAYNSSFRIYISHSGLNSELSDEWQLKKFENGIAVYTRNAKNSSFKELKSVTSVKSSLKSVVALLNDWDSYPKWVYKCGKSSTLKRINEKEVIHYQNVVAPWPVDNRDFIVHVKLEQDEKTKTVTITSISKHDYIPVIPDHVRIKEFTASWTLIPLKDGTTEIIYQLSVNPGGNIPAWLVNLAVVDGPYETLTHLKKMVIQEKYQKAIINYIK